MRPLSGSIRGEWRESRPKKHEPSAVSDEEAQDQREEKERQGGTYLYTLMSSGGTIRFNMDSLWTVYFAWCSQSRM